MRGGPRETALNVLDAVDRRGVPADGVLRRALDRSRLPLPDRALVTELVNGVLRHRLYLDAVLDPLARRGTGSLDAVTLNILRLGAHQILHLSRVPDHAAVNETVALVRRRRGGGPRAGLVNAILRRLVREGPRPDVPDAGTDPAGHLSVMHSVPRWLVSRWIDLLGAHEAAELCAASLGPPRMTIRVNTLKTDASTLALALAAEGIETEAGRWAPEALTACDSFSPGDLESFRRGLFYVQDEGAMIVSRVLDPRPGHRVLDACAAPGGKTTHLAQLMEDRGDIVAVDVSPTRLDMVRAACGRMGTESVRVQVADVRDPSSIAGGPFDRVLVDAPCSGLGVIRRRPDIKWRKTAHDPVRMAPLQLDILTSAWSLVRPGGALVYAVCSLEPEETTGVAADFERQAADCEPADIRPGLAGELRAEPGADRGRLLLWPHRHGTDGFFVARWVRRNQVTGADNARFQGKDLHRPGAKMGVKA